MDHCSDLENQGEKLTNQSKALDMTPLSESYFCEVLFKETHAESAKQTKLG